MSEVYSGEVVTLGATLYQAGQAYDTVARCTRDLVMAPFGQQTYGGWPHLGLLIWGYEGAGRE